MTTIWNQAAAIALSQDAVFFAIDTRSQVTLRDVYFY
jgi:hypothetical protein